MKTYSVRNHTQITKIKENKMWSVKSKKQGKSKNESQKLNREKDKWWKNLFFKKTYKATIKKK